MSHRMRGGWWLAAGAVLALAALGLAAVQLLIRHEVGATGDRAMRQYPGDRIHALMQVVDCADCGLRSRNRAVWALGEMRDRVALPVLRRHHTREQCNHTLDLCQYELGKAIKKIEGTWDLKASLHYKGTEPTGP